MRGRGKREVLVRIQVVVSPGSFSPAVVPYIDAFAPLQKLMKAPLEYVPRSSSPISDIDRPHIPRQQDL